MSAMKVTKAMKAVKAVKAMKAMKAMKKVSARLAKRHVFSTGAQRKCLWPISACPMTREIMSKSDEAVPQSSIVAFLWYGSGIVFSLCVHGVVQERVMTVPYGEGGKLGHGSGPGEELFTHSVFLVFCNRIIAVIFAFTMLVSKNEEVRPKAPLWKYFAISLSNVASTSCQYEALRWVSFPVQVLGKSFKMMPVMLMGIAVSGKSYKLRDWMVALAVTVGIADFLLTGSIAAPHRSKGSGEAAISSYGLFLLLAFLALDSFTTTFQERLFKVHKMSKYNQMFYIASFSSLTSLGSCILSGSFIPSLAFGVAHPRFASDACSLSAASVASQYFIYSMVGEFGALSLAAMMNVRQVLSMILSVLWYSHPVTAVQVCGLVVVFGALIYKSCMAMSDQNRQKKFAAAKSVELRDVV